MNWRLTVPFATLTLSVALTGCGSHEADLARQLSAEQQRTAALENRVTALEARMQTVIAGIPDDESVADATQSSTSQ